MATVKEFLPDALKELNGDEGKPAHVAYEGKVYDVSGSRLWPRGTHMMRHHAGSDLTADIQAAPHGPEVLERYPQVGILRKDEGPGRNIPRILARLLERFPFLRRHPHPMTVHFPIVFMFSADVFTLLYLVTGRAGFDLTALHCLGGGLLFVPVAMATGYYTWWLNYAARPMRPVFLKKRISLALLLVNIGVFSWRMAMPDILVFKSCWSIVYLIAVLSLFPMVAVLGWLGATLTFPIEKK
jgi:predicted heme/steroid binding protein/uncharacterized membrane protein